MEVYEKETGRTVEEKEQHNSGGGNKQPISIRRGAGTVRRGKEQAE